MDKYKFLYFESNSKKLCNFVDKYGDNINKILKSCFDINYSENCKWILQYNSFFLIDDDKVIAFGGTLYKNVVKYDPDVEKYNLIKLDRKESNSFIKTKRLVKIGPLIESLCRNSNPKYKGVGNIMLFKICEYYKKRNIDKIYIVPESNKFKIYGNGDCGVEVEKEKYLKSQLKLLEYYQKYGFYELKNHYEVDACGNYKDMLHVVFFPVYYKQL